MIHTSSSFCNVLLLSGHYMFVEASGKNNGKKAIMISPKYRGLKSQCLSFYYHMYGEHCGTLNVYTTVSRILMFCPDCCLLFGT